MRRPLGIYFCLVLMATGFFLSSLAIPYPYGRRVVQIPLDTGQRLKGWLWAPLDEVGKGRRPGVVLVHGVASSKESVDVTARFLARQGLVVLTFDLPGAAESRGVIAALPDAVWAAQAFLRQQPWVRADQIALMGHSLGAQAVLAVAEESPKLALFGALGYHPPPAQSPPCQAFYGAGRYDVLHPPAQLQKPSVASPCRHTFWVSPAADHTTVMGDPLTLQALWRWLQQEWGQTPTAPDMRDTYARWGSWLYGAGFIGAALMALVGLSAWQRLILLGGMGVVIWGLTELHLLAVWDGSSALMGLLLLAILQPWASKRLFVCGGLGVTFVCMWLITEVLQVGISGLMAFPALFFQSLLHWPMAFLHLLRSVLFASYSDQLHLSWLWVGLVFAEYLRPGIVLAPIILLSEGWIAAPSARLPSAKMRWVLLATGAILLAVVAWRWQQGYVYSGAVGNIGRVLTWGLVAVGATITVGRGLAYILKRAALTSGPL